MESSPTDQRSLTVTNLLETFVETLATTVAPSLSTKRKLGAKETSSLSSRLTAETTA